MTLLDRLHALAAKIGISPKVLDQIVTAVVLIVANWAIYGQPLDFDALRGVAFFAVLALVGIAAPPALGARQDVLNARARNEAALRRQR